MNRPTVRFYFADQLPNRGLSRGITAYTLGLVSHLRATADYSLEAVVSRNSIAAPEGVRAIRLPFSTGHVAGRLFADHFHPSLIPAEKPSFWHYPKGFLPSQRPKQPTVGTVADTIIQFYADHYPNRRRSRSELIYWLATLKRSIARFDLIITISEFSRRSIAEFCERHRIVAPPIVVTYLAAPITSDCNLREVEKSDYVIHLASWSPHKRTDWLLREWQRLQSRGTDLPELRLIGGLSPTGKMLLSGLKAASFEPHKERAELDAAIRGARALILPSEVEGFGLPALEAYYLGTPVAYVRGTAVEEVLGPGTPGAFEFDGESFSTALNEVLALPAEFVTAKAQTLSRRFSWDSCLKLSRDAYRQVS